MCATLYLYFILYLFKYGKYSVIDLLIGQQIVRRLCVVDMDESIGINSCVKQYVKALLFFELQLQV